LDPQALRLLDICRELNVAVPESISILGSGNMTGICTAVRPTLSSIDCDPPRIAYEAARLLDRLMAGGKPPKEIILTPPDRVVVRQSTDTMAIDDPDIVKAIRFIRDSSCSGIDVDRVAAEIGVSRSVLQRRFRQHLRRTPKEEILRIQIERAKVLLAMSGKIGENVARKCGFSSKEYFSKAFRREVGMTPQAYRRCRLLRDAEEPNNPLN
jgi:LacI family transcriptional regulator